jgi:hypothetical protein
MVVVVVMVLDRATVTRVIESMTRVVMVVVVVEEVVVVVVEVEVKVIEALVEEVVEGEVVGLEVDMDLLRMT